MLYKIYLSGNVFTLICYLNFQKEAEEIQKIMAASIQITRACYELIQAFFLSSPSESLSSLKLSSNDKIFQLHQHLQLPLLYPSCFNSSLHQRTQKQVLKTYKDFLLLLSRWELDQLSMSYNGGKDCLLQLIIYLAAIHQYIVIDKKGKFANKNDFNVKAVYVHTETEFDEQIQFLQQSVLQYGLDFKAVYTLFNGKDESNESQILTETSKLENHDGVGSIECLFSSTATLPCGFLTYLKSDEVVKSIIVGIRRTDPYGESLKLEQRTDTNRGWPDFVRINPILEWHTSEVWYFIKWLERESINSDFKITYCSLYDEGYTSLGGCDNTIKNPKLKRKVLIENNKPLFWPAWWVLEDDIERLSRVQKGKV
jgi:FAD synthetase